MKQIALLIGNEHYEIQGMNLKSPIKDVNSLGKTLEELGFMVRMKNDLTANEMGMYLPVFAKELTDYEVGLFFFAGHGFQVDGKNYIACKDTGNIDEETAKNTGFLLDNIIDIFQKSKLRVVIFIIDACRGYISGGIRGCSEGLAPISAPKGTIIAFSTSPGQTAREDSDHGFYTGALLNHIKTPKISIEEMFKRVRNEVYQRTAGKQVTWEHTSLLGDYYFNSSFISPSDIPYSSIAMADYDYTPAKPGLCRNLINGLKTPNWYTQNLTIRELERNYNALTSEERDDVFVLGRNLYQALCGGAYDVIDWVSQIENNLQKIPDRPAKDLLAGMVFEIYFNNKGKLRDTFKIAPLYYERILLELQSDRYEEERLLINDKLSAYTQRVMYIPGNDPIEIDIKLHENKGKFCLEKMTSDGIDIMYDSDRINLFDFKSEIGALITESRESRSTIEDLYTSIRQKMAATKRGVTFRLETNLPEDAKVFVPKDFVLLRYGDNRSDQI